MAAFTHFSRKFLFHFIKTDVRPQLQFNNSCLICVRLLNYSPKEYDGSKDPAPIFFKNEVQSLLRNLTRVDLAKVYKKRKLGEKRLSQPILKFMTDAQLQESMEEIRRRVDNYMQIPPAVSIRKHINKVLSKDPELTGLESSKLIFTDITFGLRDSERLITIRETDGTLREADWEVRDRINQIYFPVENRSLKPPKMFEDHYLENLLNGGEYEFVLDRACLQFEPNDPLYQKIASVTYQHLNDNNEFEKLRSTRHFGALAFFLTWNKTVDNLLLDLIETSHVDEAASLVDLYSSVHDVQIEGDRNLLQTVENFIKKYADKKGALELALQAYRETEKQRRELDDGIKRAHGLSS